METTEEQLGIYFPTDGKLGVEYATVNNLIRKKDENGNNIGGYLDPDKRNITALKLRGEKSDGLFMPLKSLESFTDITKLTEGEIITILNDTLICEKYIPNRNYHKNTNGKTKNLMIKTTTYPNFYEHVETGQLAYNLNSFKSGDICTITLKMHGTSGRTAYTTAKKIKGNKLSNFIRKKLNLPAKYQKNWTYISGTRRCILDTYSGGYYGDNEFRKQHEERFISKLNKGETIYYEIVGYAGKNTPIMADCNNKKVNDKEFVRKYGETTRFSYGCELGQSDIYVYRMTITNEDGYTVEYSYEQMKNRCEMLGAKVVPKFETFIFSTEEDLMERVEKYYDGADPIGVNHIREGVVVRIENKSTFTAYKHKNFTFKVLEGITKESANTPDIEEVQDVNW